MLYVTYNEDDTLLPSWMVAIVNWASEKRNPLRHASKEDKDGAKAVSMASVLVQTFAEAQQAKSAGRWDSARFKLHRAATSNLHRGSMTKATAKALMLRSEQHDDPAAPPRAQTVAAARTAAQEAHQKAEKVLAKRRAAEGAATSNAPADMAVLSSCTFTTPPPSPPCELASPSTASGVDAMGIYDMGESNTSSISAAASSIGFVASTIGAGASSTIGAAASTIGAAASSIGGTASPAPRARSTSPPLASPLRINTGCLERARSASKGLRTDAGDDTRTSPGTHSEPLSALHETEATRRRVRRVRRSVQPTLTPEAAPHKPSTTARADATAINLTAVLADTAAEGAAAAAAGGSAKDDHDQTRRADPLTFNRLDGGGLCPSRALSGADHEKLLFFESLFPRMDVDCSGELTVREALTALSYLGLDIAPSVRSEAVKEASVNGIVLSFEWLELCCQHLWEHPRSQLELGLTAYLAAIAKDFEKRRGYWRTVGQQIDRWARFWVLLTYILSLGMLFSIDLRDPYGNDADFNTASNGRIYDGEHAAVEMYTGLWRVDLSPRGWVTALTAPGILVVLGCLVTIAAMMHRLKQQQKRKQYEKQRNTRLKLSSLSSLGERVASSEVRDL